MYTYRTVLLQAGLFMVICTLFAKSAHASMCLPAFMAKNIAVATLEGETLECGPHFIGTRYHFQKTLSLKGTIPEQFTVLSDDKGRCTTKDIEQIPPEYNTLQFPPEADIIDPSNGQHVVLALSTSEQAAEYIFYSCHGLLAQGSSSYAPQIVWSILTLIFIPSLLFGFIIGFTIVVYLNVTFPLTIIIILSVALIYYLAVFYLIFKTIKHYKRRQ